MSSPCCSVKISIIVISFWISIGQAYDVAVVGSPQTRELKQTKRGASYGRCFPGWRVPAWLWAALPRAHGRHGPASCLLCCLHNASHLEYTYPSVLWQTTLIYDHAKKILYIYYTIVLYKNKIINGSEKQVHSWLPRRWETYLMLVAWWFLNLCQRTLVLIWRIFWPWLVLVLV
jgi:hypothetical protein